MRAEAWDLAPAIFRAARVTVDPTNLTQTVMQLDEQTTAYANALPHALAVAALETAIAAADSDISTLLTLARGRQLAR